MDSKNLTNKVNNFVSNKKNNAYAIRLVAELYAQLIKSDAEKMALQRENEVLEHQLTIAEKYILG